MLGLIPVNSDLAAYYHLDGNSNDATSNANNGTDTNITYGAANGKFGQGALFNGTTSKIDINSITTTLATSTTGTISFWAKNTETTNTSEGCVAFYNITGTTYLTFVFDWTTANKRFDFYLSIDGVIQWRYRTAVNSLVALAGSWHNIVLVHTGSQPILYVDGKQQTLTAVTTTNITKWFKAIFTDAVAKANLALIANTTYKGCLDEMIITKSKAWNPNEVKKYYSQCKGFI